MPSSLLAFAFALVVLVPGFVALQTRNHFVVVRPLSGLDELARIVIVGCGNMYLSILLIVPPDFEQFLFAKPMNEGLEPLGYLLRELTGPRWWDLSWPLLASLVLLPLSLGYMWALWNRYQPLNRLLLRSSLSSRSVGLGVWDQVFQYWGTQHSIWLRAMYRDRFSVYGLVEKASSQQQGMRVRFSYVQIEFPSGRVFVPTSDEFDSAVVDLSEATTVLFYRGVRQPEGNVIARVLSSDLPPKKEAN